MTRKLVFSTEGEMVFSTKRDMVLSTREKECVKMSQNPVWSTVGQSLKAWSKLALILKERSKIRPVESK